MHATLVSPKLLFNAFPTPEHALILMLHRPPRLAGHQLIDLLL